MVLVRECALKSALGAAVMINVLQAEALGRMQSFMQWLTQLCCDSLYPGAAHARCHFAIHCLQVVLLAYQDDNWLQNPMHTSSMHTSPSSAGSKAKNTGVQKKFRKDPEMLQQLPHGEGNSALQHSDPLASCIRSSESFVQVSGPIKLVVFLILILQ